MISQIHASEWLNHNVTHRFRARQRRMSITRILDVSLFSPPSPALSEEDYVEHDAFVLSRCAPYTKGKKKITPKPPDVRTQNKNYSVFTRIQCLTLYEYGVKARIAEEYCEVGGRRPNGQTVARWLRKAIKQGYDRTVSRVLLPEHVQDKSRSGRPKITSPTLEAEIIADST